MGKLLLILGLIFSTSFARGNVCAQTFSSSAMVEREVRNALLRITNIAVDFQPLTLSHRSGEKSQIVVLIFEKTNSKESIFEHIQEEILYLKANILVAPKIESGNYVLATKYLNEKTNLFKQKTHTKTEVDAQTQARAESIRGSERRMVKFFAGAFSFFPTAVFSAISLAIDLPAKEFIIPIASFSSTMAFRHFSRAIDKHYAAKSLDAKREVDLDENRDVTSIYPYEILRQVDRLLIEGGAHNDIHVVLVPAGLEANLKQHLGAFENFQPSALNR